MILGEMRRILGYWRYSRSPLADSFLRVAGRRLLAVLAQWEGVTLLYPREGAWLYAVAGWDDWFVRPEHEGADWRFVRDHVGEGDLLIDGGCNVGAYAIMAAARGAWVAAVDAGPRALDAIRRTVAWNGGEIADRVWIIRGALAARMNEVVTFDEPLYGGCGRVSSSGQKVRTLTLDAILEEHPREREIRRIFVKLDIEGYEAEALRGASQLLADPRLRFLLVERAGDLRVQADCERILGEAGLMEYTYDPLRRRVYPGRIEKLKKRFGAQNNGLWGPKLRVWSGGSTHGMALVV